MSFETIYLAMVAAAFATFAVSLASISVWSRLGGKAPR